MFGFAKPITIKKEEKKEARRFIREYLKNGKGISGPGLTRAVNKILKQCEEGWPQAPDSFKGRILVKLNLKADGSKKSEGGYADDKTGSKVQHAISKRVGRKFTDEDDPVEWISLRLTITEDERIYLQSRMKMYMDEFQLNSSSDLSVLQSICLEEIIQVRAQNEVLKATRGETVNPAFLDILKDSNKRIADNLKLLGISGFQRKGEKTSAEGSIGELAKVYEKTVQEYPEIEEKWAAEELVMILRKFIRNECTPEQFGVLTMLSFGKYLTPEEGRGLYDKFLERGILDPEKDSLKRDNFNRDLDDLEKFDFDHILGTLEQLNKEEEILE